MNRFWAAIALTVLGCGTASAFDADTAALVALYKSHKPVAAGDLQTLMSSSERWCYAQGAGACSWTDVYLDVTSSTARFEIGSAWDDGIDIAYSESGTFGADGRLCETPDEKFKDVYAHNAADRTAITGRQLRDIRNELAAIQNDGPTDCFDYLYLSSDTDTQTIDLLQRQYSDDVYLPEQDVTVTLHFDPANAQALTLRR